MGGRFEAEESSKMGRKLESRDAWQLVILDIMFNG
jgi:hypothetical protein